MIRARIAASVSLQGGVDGSIVDVICSDAPKCCIARVAVSTSNNVPRSSVNRCELNDYFVRQTMCVTFQSSEDERVASLTLHLRTKET
eukprot:scaffold14762_cov193-Alexandrium_tamarense.AAC.8